MRIQPTHASVQPPQKRPKNPQRKREPADREPRAETAPFEPIDTVSAPPGENAPRHLDPPKDRDRALQLAELIRTQLAALNQAIAPRHDPRNYGRC